VRSVQQLGELGLIRRLRESGSSQGTGVRTGIGDDTAVLDVARDAVLLATTDLIVEGVHFRPASATFHDIGWKALAVNLSDIGSMGGTPRWALVALALPASAETKDVDDLYAGMREAAAPYGVVIVGGDTSASPGGWLISVTLLGEHTGTPRLRSMARPGDAIAVTGSLGRSAAGLAALEGEAAPGAGDSISADALEEITRAHRRPRARVLEGRWLGEQPTVHALMDCSDGLATDLGHICRESVIHATVMLERLPLSPAVLEAARAFGRDPSEWATGGGEDYELLLTCEPAAAASLAAGLLGATGTPLTVIGDVAAGEPGITWVGAGGVPVRIRAGYEHFRG
jgi:thiamine-monophosphate kinase